MNILLYFIAFLEGFTTLSVEIMAIRNSITLIGSNAIATSIILGVILLALSYGYYRWWVYAASHDTARIKKKIFANLIIASIFYTFVSFPFENTLLSFLLGLNIGYFLPICIGISLLFIFPVFLASQTIPLLSELVQGEKKSVVIGKLLFFSTIGSFLWSVVTSLLFFAYIWVERSIVVNGIILAWLSLLIALVFARKDISKKLVVSNIALLFFLILLFFSDWSLITRKPYQTYEHSSAYNTIEIFDDAKIRTFMMNGSNSSGLDVLTGKSSFEYIKQMTTLIDFERPKNILIIWAAGFTLPQDIASRDFVEQLDVVDIDGTLDTLAQKHFLKEELHPKITFIPKSARHFIRESILSAKKYDFIVLDAYNGKISIPSELLTKEFFESIEKISSWTIAMNLIMDSARVSDFSRALSATLVASLGDVFITPMYKWSSGYYDNFIAINRNIPMYEKLLAYPDAPVYTDNRNTLELDKYTLFYKNNMN